MADLSQLVLLSIAECETEGFGKKRQKGRAILSCKSLSSTAKTCAKSNSHGSVWFMAAPI